MAGKRTGGTDRHGGAMQPTSSADRSRRGTSSAGASERSFRGRLFNARDAVEYLGISLSTLNRIEREGLLVPFRTPGGHRRYRQQMLDEYLEGTRQRPNGPKAGEDETT
jgi:hypothetical protein